MSKWYYHDVKRYEVRGGEFKAAFTDDLGRAMEEAQLRSSVSNYVVFIFDVEENKRIKAYKYGREIQVYNK